MTRILESFKRIYIQVVTLSDLRFSVDVKVQKNFLNSLPTPSDDIERSYLQYRCLVFLLGRKKWIVLQIASLLSLPIYIFKYFLSTTNSFDKIEQLICFTNTSVDKIPCSIRKNAMLVDIASIKRSLNVRDLLFLFPIIIKYPFSFLFILKIINKISLYSALISSYNPEYIYGSNEYNIVSSVLTKYCEDRNVKHCNFMHGEKVFYIRDSYCHFHVSYIWDEHYKDLFTSLKHNCDKYIIEIPFNIVKIINKIDSRYDLCYYLSAEKNEILVNIFKLLHEYSKIGNKVCVRMHPIWTNTDEIERLAKKYNIRIQKNSIDIYTSISLTKSVIALYSTVLFQAYLLKKNVIIDDLSNPEYYYELTKLMYIIFEKKYVLFSELFNSDRNIEQ